MRIGIFNRYAGHNIKNAVFDPEAYALGSGMELPGVLLREMLMAEGHSFDTTDLYPLESYDLIIFNDMPSGSDFAPFKELKAKKYLIILESDLIHPAGWDKRNHQFFDKIFTWSGDLVDNKKYFKYYWANPIPKKINRVEKTGFATLIAGNKVSPDKRELYSARAGVISWFEKKHPEDFDFYGIGWEKALFFGRKLYRGLSRIPFFHRVFRKLFRIFYRSSPLYKGRVDSKLEVLSSYKFCFCYENARLIPDYITEKIFDCFFAGTIPVYWGAPNITDYIPEDIFIDYQKFKNLKELYLFLKDMTDKDYRSYLKRTEEFLKSDKMSLFSAENYAKTIFTQIVE